MNHLTSSRLSALALAITSTFTVTNTFADTITDWNQYTIWATKGATSLTTGTAKIAQNSNVSTRIDAIQARAAFDAVNAVNHFSTKFYYYSNPTTGSVKTDTNAASAAAAQASHDVLFGLLPNPTDASWAPTRDWLDKQLAAELTKLGISNTDPAITQGKNSAAAALKARAIDFAAIRTTYTPSINQTAVLSATGTASIVIDATHNPGIGLWRPSNGGAGSVDPKTGAPTGFDDAGVIQPTAAIDFNWKNVTPFSLTTLEKQQLVALVPPSLTIGSDEYTKELDFVKTHGGGSANADKTTRTDDQTLQALYYKSDAELFINEAARLGSKSRNYSLEQNAKLFAALDNALADARIAAWQSKYDLVFWRPITAINANADGSVTDYSKWKPLATTPSHPSSTGGHSSTIAAGTEIIRAFFKSDKIVTTGAQVTLTTLPWLTGTNNGTGKLSPAVNGKDGTTRDVDTLTNLQLENGRSRIYLGVHFANDDYQGQTLGLNVADQILKDQTDPAVAKIAVLSGANIANAKNLKSIFVANSAASGFFGL
jgi:hypothetical protein